MFNSTATEAALLVDSPPSHIKKTAGESGTVPFGARSVLKVPYCSCSGTLSLINAVFALIISRFAHTMPVFLVRFEAWLLVKAVSLDRSGCD